MSGKKDFWTKTVFWPLQQECATRLDYVAHAAEKWDMLDIWVWDGDAHVMLEMKPSCYGTWRCGFRQKGRQGWSRRQGILQCPGCLTPLLSASLLSYFSVTVNQGLTLQLFLIDHFPRTLTYRFFSKHLLSRLLGNCQVWDCWVVQYMVHLCNKLLDCFPKWLYHVAFPPVVYVPAALRPHWTRSGFLCFWI